MEPPETVARPSLIETSGLIALLCILAVAVIGYRLIETIPELGAGGVVVDFDAFYITGQMVWEGRLAEAYDPEILQARQGALSRDEGYMPWTYPPQFDLVVALLPLAPRGLAYGLFLGLSFALFLHPLWRLAGRYTPAVLLVAIPSLCVNAFVGQNGFLTGGLMALAALQWPKENGRAGLPLGLMVIKPHLAVTMGVLALVTPRWKLVLWAMATILVSGLLATLAFGPQIWTAFLEGTAAAKANMAEGRYPLYRMTSVYAALQSLGLSAGAALALHLGVALAALAAVVWAARFSGWAPRRGLGLAMLLSLTISPYSYDYDVTIMAVGLAVLAADLIEHGRIWERAALLALAWVAGGAGLTQTLLRGDAALGYGVSWFPPSYGAFAYLALIALVWRMLARRQAAETAARPLRGARAARA